jgi:hypothetical protein
VTPEIPGHPESKGLPVRKGYKASWAIVVLEDSMVSQVTLEFLVHRG